MKRDRLALVGVAVLLALAGGWFALRGRGKGKGKGQETVAAAAGGGAERSGSVGQAAIDVRAAKRGAVAGQVRDENGAAIAGALVCATVRESEDLTDAETREPRCAPSGAGGGYTIGGLYAATYTVSASAARFRPAIWRGPDRRGRIEVPAGETRGGIDLVLRGGGVEVKGRVRDVSGGGIAEAIVTADGGWSRDDAGQAIGKSDAEGNFTLWVAEGDVNVAAQADGYGPGSTYGTAPGQFIEVLLTPESVLVGRVVEAGSQTPVAGARVSANGSNEGWMDWEAMTGTAVTDGEGRFRVERLPPGRYKPEAEAGGRYGRARESVLLGLGQTSDEVVIEAHLALHVSGHVVVTPGDTPCPMGSVSLTRKRDTGGQDGTDIAADGSFLFKAVMPGSYTVEVRCQDKVSEDEYPSVEVGNSDVTDLELTVREGRALRGTVLLPDGKPAEGATIWAETSGGDPRGQRTYGWGDTDAAGAFELKGLIAGKYRLNVNPVDGLAPDEPPVVEVAADRDTEGVTIKLEGGARISGVVVDEDGAPQGGVNVFAMAGDRWRWSGGGRAQTADDGTFTLRDVTPGEVRVIAQRGWGNELRAPGKSDDDVQGERVMVRAGESKTVRLVVERQSGEIRGKVTDAAGAAVVDAFVSAQREEERAGAAAGSALRSSRWQWGDKPVVTELDGAFTIGKLSPGQYTIRAFRKGGGEGIVEHVAVGKTTTVVIATTGSILGTVTSPGGAPDRFQITIFDRQAAFRRSEQFFRTSGAWAMRDLPPGAYEVSASAEEGTATVEIPLTVGQHKTGVVLELEARATLRGSVVDLETGAPVPGMRAMARGVKGGARTPWRTDQDKKMITGDDGRYELEDAPAGRIWVSVFPMDWEGGEYSYGTNVVEAVAGQVTDVPPIRVVKKRLKSRERPGDLGFELEDQPPAIEPEQRQLKVALIRPDGPAAQSGLKVGDLIVSVDGHDVTGPSFSLYYSLASVREGTAITLGLARGAGAQITAAKPL